MGETEKVFLKYWHLLPLQKRESVPRRSAINPRDISHLLPLLLIQEWISIHVLMVRLTGTKVDEILGRNFTGTNSYEIGEPGIHSWMDRVLEIALNTPCGVHTTSVLTRVDGATFNANLLQLPMNNGRGETTFLAGLMGVDRTYRDAHDRGTGLLQAELRRTRFVDLGFSAPDFEG